MLPDEIIRKACCGNEAAERFCTAFVRWVAWLDDAFDKDRVWSAQETADVNLAALLSFSDNPFFQQYKAVLVPLVVQACRAWADSEQFAQRPEIKDRRAADVLKSSYHEVIWHVAYICAGGGDAGWKRMAALTAECRIFDYDCKD